VPSLHAPELAKAVLDKQQGIPYKILLLLATEEHLVLACFDSSQIILDQSVERHFIVAQESRVHLSLRNEIRDDKEEDVEAGGLVVSELDHAVKDQVGIVVLKQVFEGQELKVRRRWPRISLERWQERLRPRIRPSQVERQLDGQEVLNHILLDLRVVLD
jgi:hypothetical protein